MIRFDKPMIGFCAYSGTGKTTLLARLLPMLKAEGLRVAVVKHAHHQFEIDKPMIGFCAYSGTGKTTLLARLLPMLKAEGLRVAVVKHAHHQFEIDKPGKDSHTFREAGADQILVASRSRMAWIQELPEQLDEPSLQQAVNAICPDAIDLLLVEGFKHEAYPKIELHRCALGKPLIHPSDPDVVAFACDQTPEPMPKNIPVLDINDPQGILEFVMRETLGKTMKESNVQAITR